jgi:hypothetical protein
MSHERRSQGQKRIVSIPLTEIAKPEPSRLFNQIELARLLHVSRDSIREIARAGAPFYHGRSRPEWLLDWIKEYLTREMIRKPE